MNKLSRCLILTLLGLSPGVAGPLQRGGGASPERARKYDKATDRTEVGMKLADECMTAWNVGADVPPETRCFDNLVATFTFHGRKLRRPVDSVVLDYYSVTPRPDKSDDEVLAFVDGEKISLGYSEAVPQKLEKSSWRHVRFSVGAPLIVRIANGRDVSLRIAGSERQLKRAQLRRFRELARIMSP